jgi:hypothetical protein
MFIQIDIQVVYRRPFLTHRTSAFRRKSGTDAIPITSLPSSQRVELNLHFFIWLHRFYQEGLSLLIHFRNGQFASKNKYLLRWLLWRAEQHNLQNVSPATQSYAARGYIWREWTCFNHSLKEAGIKRRSYCWNLWALYLRKHTCIWRQYFIFCKELLKTATP